MKGKRILKYYLLLTIIGMSYFVMPTIVKATPAHPAFKDDNFYNCVLTSAGLKDGTVITDEQIKKITSLSCSSKKITNTSGLELMTSLKRLDLSNNQLTSIDLSKNTKLTDLDLDKNSFKIKISIKNNKKDGVLKYINTCQNCNLKLYDKRDKEKTDNIIGTGNKIKIQLGSKFVGEYISIVSGDTTGDGKATVADVAKLYQYLKKKIEMDECYKEAGDVVGTDSQIKINDVAKLYQFIKGKINNLEG